MKAVRIFNSEKEILLDDADFALVNARPWYLDTKGYPFRYVPAIERRNGESKIQRLHTFLLGRDGKKDVDHIDLNRLNYCRGNLRFATRSQNKANTFKRPGLASRFKGVSWDKSRNKWQAKIQVRGLHINLGRYSEEGDAARAYDKAAIKYFGEFARINFPFEHESKNPMQPIRSASAAT